MLLIEWIGVGQLIKMAKHAYSIDYLYTQMMVLYWHIWKLSRFLEENSSLDFLKCCSDYKSKSFEMSKNLNFQVYLQYNISFLLDALKLFF